MATRGIVPRADNEGSIGTALKRWAAGIFNSLTAKTLVFEGGADSYLVVPSLTTTQRTALTPAEGMIVYDSDLSELYKYVGSAWVSMATISGTVAIANGGTGQTSAAAAIAALMPSDSIEQGDIVYWNGSAWVLLHHGTDGYYLKTQGDGANPVWAAVSGGSGAYQIRRYIEGELYTTTLMFHRVNAAATITEARATIGSIPVGANILVDVRKLDATHTTNVSTASIFSSDTPITLSTGGSLTYGVYSQTGTLDTANDRDDCSAGDVLLVVVTQVGSTSPGNDLEVIISLSPA